MAYTNKDLLAARSGGDALATGLAQLADALAERLIPLLLARLSAPESDKRGVDSPPPKPLPVTDADRARAVRWLQRKGRL